jgi:hypothetical protein
MGLEEVKTNEFVPVTIPIQEGESANLPYKVSKFMGFC